MDRSDVGAVKPRRKQLAEQSCHFVAFVIVFDVGHRDPLENEMEPLFYVMAIMGCGDGNVNCTEARVIPARYETMAQCRAALPDQLAQNTDVPYPMIGANCRAQGQLMAKAGKAKSQG
jgi:hypothetical protein